MNQASLKSYLSIQKDLHQGKGQKVIIIINGLIIINFKSIKFFFLFDII